MKRYAALAIASQVNKMAKRIFRNVVLTAVFAAVCAAAARVAVHHTENGYTPIKAAVVDGENSVFSRFYCGKMRHVETDGYIPFGLCSYEYYRLSVNKMESLFKIRPAAFQPVRIYCDFRFLSIEGFSVYTESVICQNTLFRHIPSGPEFLRLLMGGAVPVAGFLVCVGIFAVFFRAHLDS